MIGLKSGHQAYYSGGVSNQSDGGVCVSFAYIYTLCAGLVLNGIRCDSYWRWHNGVVVLLLSFTPQTSGLICYHSHRADITNGIPDNVGSTKSCWKSALCQDICGSLRAKSAVYRIPAGHQGDIKVMFLDKFLLVDYHILPNQVIEIRKFQQIPLTSENC